MILYFQKDEGIHDLICNAFFDKNISIFNIKVATYIQEAHDN